MATFTATTRDYITSEDIRFAKANLTRIAKCAFRLKSWTQKQIEDRINEANEKIEPINEKIKRDLQDFIFSLSEDKYFHEIASINYINPQNMIYTASVAEYLLRKKGL